MLQMLNQMFWLPCSMLAWSMDMLAGAMRSMQLQAMGRQAFEAPRDSNAPGTRSPQRTDGLHRFNQGAWGDRAATDSKEESTMSDTDLSNDRVKLVQYAIVSVKREREEIFTFDQILVTDDMTGEAFATWVVARYIQEPDRPGHREIPHGDKKYLRVYYSVLDSWPRESLHYEERQLDALRGIEHAIRECCEERDRRPAYGGGPGPAAGPAGGPAGGPVPAPAV